MRTIGWGTFGAIRKEGGIRIAGALVLAVLCAGCGSQPKSQPDKPDADLPAAEPRQVNTGEAEATRTSEGPNPQPLWKVRWKSATLEFGAAGEFGGTMQTVSGVLFEAKSEASRFTATRAEADKATGNLTLTGSVVVTSIAHGATLRCDEVRYSSKERRLIRATGDVRIGGAWGAVGGMEELHANPDLSRFGSPDLFASL